MSQSMLERDVVEAFDKATTPNTIERNLDKVNKDFEYLFSTIFLPIHNIDQGLPANTNRNLQQKNTPSDSIFVPNNLLARLVIQDIISANSAKTT